MQKTGVQIFLLLHAYAETLMHISRSLEASHETLAGSEGLIRSLFVLHLKDWTPERLAN